ncbi:protein Mak11p [[Candida] anglica]|uniref:Protein Mak11p n=1 Tax=[Candida] anglica TaxID=148631 RepID=A0ABP0EG68_9ASCO
MKSALKGSAPSKKSGSVDATPAHFRIMVGSYEHNLLCLSLILRAGQPVFQPVFHFQAHTLSIKAIDLAKRYLVTGSNDEHIRIYDLQKRKELGTLLSHQGTVTTLKFSREGNAATKVVKSKVEENKRGPKSTEEKETSPVEQPPVEVSAAAAAASSSTSSTGASGKWLLSGSEDGKIIIWRTKDWESFGILKGHTDRVNDLSIHPSGRVAISVSKDQTIRLWNLMTAKKAAVLKIRGKDHLGQAGEFVRWTTHDNGAHFLVGLLNQVLVYETSAARIIKKVTFTSTMMCMEVMEVAGKQYFVTGHTDGRINFYSIESQMLVRREHQEDEDKIWETKPEAITPEFTLHGHTNRVKDITLFCDQRATNGIPYLISVSSDGKIVVWDLTESVRDQVAVYDSGERLNCVVACPEDVEKMDSMKKRSSEFDEEDDIASGSEYETDGEEIKAIMKGGNKRGKKNKRSKKTKVSVTLE